MFIRESIVAISAISVKESTGLRPETGMVVRYKMCVLYAFIAGLWISSVPFAFAGTSAETKPTTERVRSCKILYAGFVGAMETSNRQGSGVVQLRDTLSGPGYADVCAESFLAYSWESCRDWIMSRLPGNSGSVTEAGSKIHPGSFSSAIVQAASRCSKWRGTLGTRVFQLS